MSLELGGPAGPLQVLVLSRQEAEMRFPDQDEVCISITNPKQAPAHVDAYADLLRLGFHDTDRVGGMYTAMTESQAADVLAFLLKHRKRPMMIHCEAGASRSAAIGLFAAALLNRPLRIANTDVLVPNEWVLNQLRAAALRAGLRTLSIDLVRAGLRSAEVMEAKIRLQH